MHSVFHNQASDRHTPGIGFQLGTPLSMSASENHSNSASAVDMHGFQHHMLHAQPFHQSNSFAQQQTYAPSSFIHQDSGYETMNPQQRVPNDEKKVMHAESQEESHYAEYGTGPYENMSSLPLQSLEKYAFAHMLIYMRSY